ncbi:uncharacterized protein BDFB_007249, partial [Asbolus verrucosus]
LTVISLPVSHTQPSSLCPKRFVPIGRKCYHFSKDETTWNDAHFRCSKLNSSLAVITGSHQELLVRRYLNRHRLGRYERWLGGKFNDKKLKWVWAQNGKPLTFHGFSRMNPRDKQWAWHCIILDPERQYKWGARSCVSKNHYICAKKSYKKKNVDKTNCNNNNTTSNSTELCSKNSVGKRAPGLLMNMPKKKKYKPYNPATFICPSHMILVGRKCYFFSLEEANWSDAYWACRDNKTKLATIMTKMEDNILRGFLNGNFTEKHERWIGGIYDWKQRKWKWAMSGRPLRYKHFARAALENTNHTQHCITLDPQYKHLWNSRNRLERKHYICQARSKSVVKYEKPQKFKPDATVIIQFDNNNILQDRNLENTATEAS